MEILVAEDEALVRVRLLAQLKAWGLEPLACEDGDQAWEILQTPQSPKLALIDWMMPGADGPELCRRVRRLEHDRPPLRLDGLTGPLGQAGRRFVMCFIGLQG